MISEKGIRFIVDLLFPEFCLNCRAEGTYACENCLEELKILQKHCCPHCRRVTERGEFCSEKCQQNYHFDQLIVGTQYDRDSFLKKIIVRFKYKFSEELAEILGSILIAQLQNIFDNFEDCSDEILLVPVPLHVKKLRQRGFNQARLLAENVGSYFDLVMLDCLVRMSLREDQAKLDREGRLENLRDNFEVCESYRDLLKGKVIFLIDDVATTGSTLNECSKVLKNCGASWVCGLVIARGR